MLKNFSTLAFVGAFLFGASATGCILVTDDSGTGDEDQTGETTESPGDGDGDATGDGDGDGDTTTGDGDGDPATGDGDGDATGDGDGDATGDGDGDATGDGDGDPGPLGCGWDPGNEYYECDFEGEDPGGNNPIGCPDGLVNGDACDVTGLPSAGCCDAEGNNWYCAEGDVAFLNACGE